MRSKASGAAPGRSALSRPIPRPARLTPGQSPLREGRDQGRGRSRTFLEPTAQQPQNSAALSGLLGRCPACGKGKLFSGYIALPPACSTCGLDYGFADAGDGPAVFVMLIAGFLALGFALWFEFAHSPPVWTHLAVSLPVTLAVCLALLRLLKGLLIALQHRNDAAEGRLDL